MIKLFPWRSLSWSNISQPMHWYRTDKENHDPKYAWGFVEVYRYNDEGKWMVYWKDKKYNDLYRCNPYNISNNIEDIKNYIDQFLERTEKLLPFI